MNKNFELSLNLEEINQILTVLGKQPYESVYLLIDNIRREVQSQIDIQTANVNMGSSESLDQ